MKDTLLLALNVTVHDRKVIMTFHKRLIFGLRCGDALSQSSCARSAEYKSDESWIKKKKTHTRRHSERKESSNFNFEP